MEGVLFCLGWSGYVSLRMNKALKEVRVNHVNIQGKNGLSRDHSKCRGSKAGVLWYVHV